MDDDSDIIKAIQKLDLCGVKEAISNMDPCEFKSSYVDIVLCCAHRKYDNIDIFKYLIDTYDHQEYLGRTGIHVIFYILSDIHRPTHYYSDIFLESILFTIDRIKNIDLVDWYGNTILNYIAEAYTKTYDPKLLNVFRKIIDELFNRGINPNTRCSYHSNSFSLAVKYNNFELLKLLCSYKHHVDLSTVFDAIMMDNYNFVEYLLPYVKDINEIYHGNTLLYLIKNKFPWDYDIIELLQQNGAHD